METAKQASIYKSKLGELQNKQRKHEKENKKQLSVQSRVKPVK